MTFPSELPGAIVKSSGDGPSTGIAGCEVGLAFREGGGGGTEVPPVFRVLSTDFEENEGSCAWDDFCDAFDVLLTLVWPGIVCPARRDVGRGGGALFDCKTCSAVGSVGIVCCVGGWLLTM